MWQADRVHGMHRKISQQVSCFWHGFLTQHIHVEKKRNELKEVIKKQDGHKKILVEREKKNMEDKEKQEIFSTLSAGLTSLDG